MIEEEIATILKGDYKTVWLKESMIENIKGPNIFTAVWFILIRPEHKKRYGCGAIVNIEFYSDVKHRPLKRGLYKVVGVAKNNYGSTVKATLERLLGEIND